MTPAWPKSAGWGRSPECDSLIRKKEAVEGSESSIRGIARGEYTVLAWETVERGAHMDPEFLRPYRTAANRSNVDEGSKLNSQLELIPANEPAGP